MAGGALPPICPIMGGGIRLRRFKRSGLSEFNNYQVPMTRNGFGELLRQGLIQKNITEWKVNSVKTRPCSPPKLGGAAGRCGISSYPHFIRKHNFKFS